MAVLRRVIIGAFCAAVLWDATTAWCQDISQLGGALSTAMPGHNAIQLVAPNIKDEALRQQQISGFFDFHHIVDAPHTFIRRNRH